jgi:hypothetical protein
MGPGNGDDPSGTADKTGQGLQAVMGQIRDLSQMAQSIGSTVPSLQQEAQQIQMIVRSMVKKAGMAAPTQTGSAAALPTG